MTKEGWALRFLLRLVVGIHERPRGNPFIREEADDLCTLLAGGMTMLEFVNKYPEYDTET